MRTASISYMAVNDEICQFSASTWTAWLSMLRNANGRLLPHLELDDQTQASTIPVST